jgi:hypothetical protein
MYRFQLLRPNRNNAYLKVGSHRQQFYLSDRADIDPSKLLTWKKEKSEAKVSAVDTDDIPSQVAGDKSPSNNPDIPFDDFIKILTGPLPKCSPEFAEAIEHAHIWNGMTDRQRDMLKRVIMVNEDAFALEESNTNDFKSVRSSIFKQIFRIRSQRS